MSATETDERIQRATDEAIELLIATLRPVIEDFARRCIGPIATDRDVARSSSEAWREACLELRKELAQKGAKDGG